MTQDKNPPTDLPDEVDRTVLAALARQYTSAPTPALREGMDRAVYARMTAPRSRPRFRVPRLGRLPLSLPAAALLVLVALTGYQRLSAPTPVSAQHVLRRAAVVQLAPNTALHLVYRVTVTFPGGAAAKGGDQHAGTADVWFQSNAAGVPDVSAQTLTLDGKNLFSRFIQMGGQTYSYDPELRGDNTISINPETRADPAWLVPNHMFDGATVARYLNAPGQQQGVQLLPAQTLDGHAVDVVQVERGTPAVVRTVLYFDAQTYLLRGFDVSSIDPSYAAPTWQVRLASDATEPVSSVTAHTFTLNAPEDAVVNLPLPDNAALSGAFQTACHSPLNLKAAMGAGETPLAVCQRTNPGVTEAEVVEALVAPMRSDLDAAVSAGQITRAQRDTALRALQAQMTAIVTTARSTK